MDMRVDPAIPETSLGLASFKDKHHGETIIVCGCGESLNLLDTPDRYITIGVNDIGRRFHPNYLVVVNPRNQFKADRFHHVASTKAQYVFTQLPNLGIPNSNIVRFRLGKNGGTDFTDPQVLHYTKNSPYVALCLAVHMGARRIGLIGVDFTDNHFFANTGTHPLARNLASIDAEYRRLVEALRARGVEVFNLSPVSRLTSLPKQSLKSLAHDESDVLISKVSMEQARKPMRVLFVHYRFLACGNIFATGLQHAASELGLVHEHVWWDTPDLPKKVRRFCPDLIFVVHGRRFIQKWRDTFKDYRSAVWLLDEPYEVDDTSSWSSKFNTVFVNDPSTLDRHQNAHYLPVCYDSSLHQDRGKERIYKVGFVGGYNSVRERYLLALAEKGLLSYVVGGPWRSRALRPFLLSEKMTPEQVSSLYQETSVVVNVFRETHHFNVRRTFGTSLNPRIYEALACGAAVVSERRPELSKIVPSLPTFENTDELIRHVSALVVDERRRSKLVAECRHCIANHTYGTRLRDALAIVDVERYSSKQCKTEQKMHVGNTTDKQHEGLQLIHDEWKVIGHVQRKSGSEDEFVINVTQSEGTSGLVSAASYNDIELSFEVRLSEEAQFCARIHDTDPAEGSAAASYRLVVVPGAERLMIRDETLQKVHFARGCWEKVVMRWTDQLLEVSINDSIVAQIEETHLQSGHCFVGAQKGIVEIRKLRIVDVAKSTISTRHVAAARPWINEEPQRSRLLSSEGITTAVAQIPVRNLLYHIWPVKGSMWRWNLEQLTKRIDLFNGHRTIAIVYDSRSEHPDVVQEIVAEHGCDFILKENTNKGESTTFPALLQSVQPTSPRDVTFYAHAKGVKYEPQVPWTVRKWTEVLYMVNLDDWRGVRSQLERYPMTGAFKMLGRFRAHQYLGDWHYSGTFFWFRQAPIMERKLLQVPEIYGGVEVWPGLLFAQHEVGCLVFDRLRELPYHERFWRSTGKIGLKNWAAGLAPVTAPPDLLIPREYEGHQWPRMEQKPEEFTIWVDTLLERRVRSLLTIGAGWGGVEWHVARKFREHGYDIEITTIERNPRPELYPALDDARTKFQQRVRLIAGDSGYADVQEQLDHHYDAVFIDGDHGYYAVAKDFLLAKSRHPALIGFHDIVDSDWHAASHCCVSRLWRSLKKQYRTAESYGSDWGGIGIVFLGPDS